MVLLLLGRLGFGWRLLRLLRAPARHHDGLGGWLAVLFHVLHADRVPRLHVGGGDVLARLLDLGRRVDGERPLRFLALLLAGDDEAVRRSGLHGTLCTLRRCLLLAAGGLLLALGLLLG